MHSLFKHLCVFILCTVHFSASQYYCPTIIKKESWSNRRANKIVYSIIPVEYVIIHHTVTNECFSVSECRRKLQNMQNFHMDTLNFHDIGYNFLIDGAGNVYEGVGWHKVGAHTSGYNTRSIGIGMIGNFSNNLPTFRQLEALHDLLDCGIDNGELDRNYKLLAARQVSRTQSPGLKLYQELQRWPHFLRI